jgi:hypothetical protein
MRTLMRAQASVDLEEHFIEVPAVTGARRLTPQAVCVSLTKLGAPVSDSVIIERDPTHR